MKTLRAWSNRVRMPKDTTDQLADELARAFGNVIGEVSKLAEDDGREFARDPAQDPLLRAIAPVLEGRVGPPFRAKDHAATVTEAQRRIGEKRPPAMLPPDSLLYWAREILGIEVTDESVQEVKRVTVGADISWNVESSQEPDLRQLVRTLINIVLERQIGSTEFRLAVFPAFGAVAGHDAKELLDAIWTMLEAAPASGIFSNNPPPGAPVSYVQGLIRQIRDRAVFLWLECAADRYMAENAAHPDRPLVFGPNPPTVVRADTQLFEWPDAGMRSIDFSAAIEVFPARASRANVT